MPGYSPKLPLELDHHDGFGLTKTYYEVAKQNLKMLILTNPGERIMEPDFGAGIRKRLFEPDTGVTQKEIQQDIYSQVKKFLPYIEIQNISVDGTTGFESEKGFGDSYGLQISIQFKITTLNISDQLDVIISV